MFKESMPICAYFPHPSEPEKKTAGLTCAYFWQALILGCIQYTDTVHNKFSIF